MAVNLMPESSAGHAVNFCYILQKSPSKTVRATRDCCRKMRRQVLYWLGCINRNEYRTAFGSRFSGSPHHNHKHRAHSSSSRSSCLLGRIPMESTIGGLSLSTNGGSNPYYWVLSRVGLILVTRRENRCCPSFRRSFAKS